MIAGKSMEAMREGAQDYEILQMLKAAQAKEQPGPLYDAMKDLLSNEVARVLKPHSSASMAWNVPKDHSSADRVRIEALSLLQKHTSLSRLDNER